VRLVLSIEKQVSPNTSQKWTKKQYSHAVLCMTNRI